MGLTIIMGNVRRVMCKVPLTSMHKPISKYHSVLVSSPKSSEPKSKKHNISNKDIINFKPTPFLNNINTVNPKFQLFIHPLLTYKILLLLATNLKFQPRPTYTFYTNTSQRLHHLLIHSHIYNTSSSYTIVLVKTNLQNFQVVTPSLG